MQKLSLLSLIVLVTFSFTACDNFKGKNINVHCLSSDGHLEVHASKVTGFNKNIGNLTFYVNNQIISNVGSEDLVFTSSALYKNADFIFSKSKKISFVIMPDRLHGIATMSEIKNGQKFNDIKTPLLCFESAH